jgi:tRNA(Ile)-lysidine synthase
MAVRVSLAIDRTLLRVGERVCVAVSGGADSAALLLALVEANAGRDGLGVVVSAAHVHHGLRGAEADGDEAFVRELCARLGVGLTLFHVDTAARQKREGEGLEEAARELRYEALGGLMRDGVVDVVATGHTLDDQAETVVMKMLRGAWTEGLGGISPVVQGLEVEGLGIRGKGLGKGRVVRPLLGVRRSGAEAFLRSRGQGWREDGSNRDVTLTRNRVRHELMPVLRGFNAGVDALLARTAEIARDEEAYWRVEVERVLPQVLLPGKPVRGGGRAVSTAVGEVSCAMEIARLAAMPAALRRRVVRAAVKSLGVGLSSEETAKVLALAGFGGYAGVQGKIGSRLELHGGLRVERSAREVRVWKNSE